MSNFYSLHWKIWICLSSVLIITGCQIESNSTSEPFEKIQLTYLSTAVSNLPHHNIYGITVGCFDEITPCFDQPELIFHTELNIINYSWSPDGQQIVFSTSDADIYIADLAISQTLTNITHNSDLDDFPSWTPDGQMISYQSCTFEGCLIFISNPDGTERRQLLDHAQTAPYLSPRQLSWAPDGERVVFVGYPEEAGLEQIFTSLLDGSEIVQLSTGRTINFSPSFSPDGKWLLYTKYSDPESFDQISTILYKLNDDTEMTLPFSFTQGPQLPTWSPIDNWIAVQGSDNAKSDIFIFKSDGSNLVNVTRDLTAQHASPAWRIIP